MKLNPIGKVDKTIILIVMIIIAYMAFSDKGGPRGAGTKKSPSANTTPAKQPMVDPVPTRDPGLWPPPAEGKVEMALDLEASNYLIVFDGSGSMSDRECSGRDPKIHVARAAVKKFIDSLGPGDNVALVGFGGMPHGMKKTDLIEHGFVSGDTSGAIQTLEKIFPMGNTPLSQAMKRGLSMLEGQARRQGGYGKYNMIIITDGVATDSDPSVTARMIVSSSMVRIHAIGFCLDGKHKLDVPGYTRYSTANNPQTLEEGLQSVLAESDQFDPGTFVEQ
ncbi:MAG: VWA domain-containing protein [Nitrospinota bacterium]|nr:VWA domain-containing protein [Nitrospinota bacterium]